MPNGSYFTKEEWEKYNGYLEEIDDILKDFSKKYNLWFDDSCYHEWPYRNIGWKIKSKTNKFFLMKTISLSYQKITNSDSAIYGIGVCVVVNYGFKEIIAFIPWFSKLRDLWPRLKWEKNTGILRAPFDKSKLTICLEQSKQALDNFNEENLEDIRVSRSYPAKTTGT